MQFFSHICNLIGTVKDLKLIKRIVTLQTLQDSGLSGICNKFCESSKLENLDLHACFRNLVTYAHTYTYVTVNSYIQHAYNQKQ